MGMRNTPVILALVVVASLTAPAHARTARCEGARATKVGTPGNDRIIGTGKRDVIAGLGGNDVIRGMSNNDVLCGGPGRDRIYGDVGEDLMDGDRGNDLLVGGRAADYIVGDEGADKLRGEGGLDRFRLGLDSGDDVIDGGRGPDWIDMSVPNDEGLPSGARGSAFVDLQAGVAEGRDGGRDRIVVGTIEHVYGTGNGDEIYGDAGPNELVAGYNGHGTLDGRGGKDTLRTGQDGGTTFLGGPGDDAIYPVESNTVDGGEGRDDLRFCELFGNPGDIFVDLAEGRSEVREGDRVTASNPLTGIENVRTCDGDDEMYGDASDNHLIAGRGTDSIDGREGTDTCVNGEQTANCEA